MRINDKVEELELQVEPLRQQSEKAKKYLVLRDTLRGLEISLWMEELDRLRTSAIKVENDHENALRQREETQKEVERLYALTESLADGMREKDMEAEKLRFATMQREADANELESAIAVLKTHIENNLENARRIREELEQQAGRAGSIGSQIEERKARLAELDEKMDVLTARRRETEAAGQELLLTSGTMTRELEALREKESSETASAAESRALLSALAAAAQELLDRDKGLRQELAELGEKLAAARREQETVEKELDEAQEERDGVKNVIAGYLLRLESREKRARQVEESRVKLQMEENALRSRIHMLTEMEKLYEGYSKAVKLVMTESERGRISGIHGPVAGLLHVPDQYAVAIEIALGGAMQHLVVDSEETGKAAIRWLKQRDGGRCTFLPLSAIRPAEFRDTAVENEPGFVGMGNALLTYDKTYERIFSNLLGRTVIAEDMDKAVAMAKKYGHRFKIVTLDGQVLNPGGSMTGGSVSRSAGILSRGNELERLGEQLSLLKERLTGEEKTLEEAQRELTAARYELETAQNQQREFEDTVLRLRERSTHGRTGIETLEQRDRLLREELERVEVRCAETERETTAARERIERLEGSAAALRTEAEGRLRGQNELQERLDALARETAAIHVEIAGLEAERAAGASGLSELEDLRREMLGDHHQRSSLAEDFEKRNESLKEQILEREQTLQTLRGTNRLEEDRLRELNLDKLELEGKRNQAEKDSREKNGILQNMEREVSLLEQKRAAAAMEEKQILDKLWESYELTHEGAQSQRQPVESPREAARRVSELKKSISALGNINIDAIEQFAQINERYTYLTDQRNDIRQAKKELEKVIGEITAEMKTIFAREFEILNRAFGETFLELFGGGKAALELEDPDDILNCGIEIKVQPPGKALKIITLLSGGEKAFVAIALYFSILKVRPTPFVVMDEIEAALDDANVIRFADYMRRMSERTQFIVITHRRGTMEEADVLYGVTMQEHGVSRLLTINLNDVEKELNIK